MKWIATQRRRGFVTTLLGLAVTGGGVLAQERPPQRPQPEHRREHDDHRRNSESVDGAVRQWTSQLVEELDHLYEDLYFDRRDEGLVQSANDALEAAIHFQEVIRRGADREHLVRDFHDMDTQLHEFFRQIPDRSRLNRAAARVRYADEQLHYYLVSRERGDRDAFRELLARHAHTLEQESRRLEQILARYRRRGDRDNSLHDTIDEFAEQAEHFHGVVEDKADREHLQRDFAELDQLWHRAVEQLNRSSVDVWARRAAARVNNVHNQLHTLIQEDGDTLPRAERPPQEDRRPAPPRRQDVRDDRPRIEFEIPGLGRFQLGR